MQINLRYFASIREALGMSEEAWQTQAPDLAALRDELIARGGVYAERLSRERPVRMALNQDLCEESTALTEGAEVALFPPVTGG